MNITLTSMPAKQALWKLPVIRCNVFSGKGCKLKVISLVLWRSHLQNADHTRLICTANSHEFISDSVKHSVLYGINRKERNANGRRNSLDNWITNRIASDERYHNKDALTRQKPHRRVAKIRNSAILCTFLLTYERWQSYTLEIIIRIRFGSNDSEPVTSYYVLVK